MNDDKTKCQPWKRPAAGCDVSRPRTLSQVEDGPGHLQPLISVRHLQRVQQPHHIRPLLLHRQLDPPPASSCRRDTTGYFQKHLSQRLFPPPWRIQCRRICVRIVSWVFFGMFPLILATFSHHKLVVPDRVAMAAAENPEWIDLCLFIEMWIQLFICKSKNVPLSKATRSCFDHSPASTGRNVVVSDSVNWQCDKNTEYKIL